MFLFLLNVLKDIFAGNRILIWHLFIFSTERCHLFGFQDCIISDEQSPVITVLSFSLQEICSCSFGCLEDFFFIFYFEEFDWCVWLWRMSLFWDNSWPLSLHIFLCQVLFSFSFCDSSQLFYIILWLLDTLFFLFHSPPPPHASHLDHLWTYL